MNWPWRRQPKIDTEAIAREAAEKASEIAATRVAEEFARVMISSSPMPGPPNPAAGGMFPLYKWDNPIWYATPQAPTRRPGSLVDTRTLRQLADNYDILRDCIQQLKREVLSVPLQIVARSEKDDSARTRRQIAEANEFLTARGGLGGPGQTREEFEGAAIEDTCVIGAMAVFYHPNRGGGLYQAITIDAATIRPRVDAWGWPGPTEEVYEQWVLGLKVAGFTREQMSYTGMPTNARSYTPYPASPVEWLIQLVYTALKADQWNRDWLISGNSANEIYALPETWTPAQVQEFTLWFDALMSGNIQERVKTKFVPSGTKQITQNSRKDQDFNVYEHWLAQRTCFVMGVHPASIGLLGDQYAVTQENSIESTTQFGGGVLLLTRKQFYDDLFHRAGWDSIEAQNVLAKEEAAKDRADRHSVLVKGSILTPNEARKEEGLDPIDGGDALLVDGNMKTLEQLLNPPEPMPIPGNLPPGAKEGNQEERSALAQWERKALNRIKQGKTAACAFESRSIRRQITDLLTARLPECRDAESVRALFHQAQGIDSDSAGVKSQIAARWHQAMDYVH